VSIVYHLRELELAQDRSKLCKLPPILPHYKRILDVGCGMGQTLIASNLCDCTEVFGVDCDAEAVLAGHKIAPSNIKLLISTGENLPFENNYFDFVFSRVSLPYMDVPKALDEMNRVLSPGGDLWLLLHSPTHVCKRLVSSLLDGNLKGVIFKSYVLVNGTILNLTGHQFRFPFTNRQETFQTARGISRLLALSGFSVKSISNLRHFTVTAKKL
jgi:ubiquinone/menaquinone biosynthesis C-methylase UbiE